MNIRESYEDLYEKDDKTEGIASFQTRKVWKHWRVIFNAFITCGSCHAR